MTNNHMHPAGETLPEPQRVFIVKVVMSFLTAGVPLSKLQHFHEVHKLADNRGMCDLIPFVMVDEVKRIKAEIGLKKL